MCLVTSAPLIRYGRPSSETGRPVTCVAKASDRDAGRSGMVQLRARLIGALAYLGGSPWDRVRPSSRPESAPHPITVMPDPSGSGTPVPR